MECEGSHFCTGGHFSPPGLGVMTRFLQTTNDPFGRRKWTPGHFFYVEKWPGVDFRWGSLFVVTPAKAVVNAGLASKWLMAKVKSISPPASVRKFILGRHWGGRPWGKPKKPYWNWGGSSCPSVTVTVAPVSAAESSVVLLWLSDIISLKCLRCILLIVWWTPTQFVYVWE